MRSTSAMAMAGLVGVSQALIPGLTGDLDLSPASFDLASSWENEVLFNGIVGVESSTDAALNLGLNINEAQVEGLVAVELIDDVIRLDLSGIKAYVAIDLSTSAAVYETVQLCASPELEVDAGLLEVALGAAFALDLVVGVGAAVDLSAGFYVSFAKGDYIDLSAITKEIVGSELAGLVTKALPIGVGAQVDLSTQIEVQLGLRLRSHVSIEAGVDLLGLDLLEAGADISIWADIAAYAFTLVETDNCVLDIQTQFALRAGIAVEVGLELLDLLDLSLAPTVNVELANTSRDKLCLNGRGTIGDFLNPKGEEGKETQIEAPEAGITATATATASAEEGMITSTISNTKTYTITSCHVSVPNCPASETQVIVTSVVESTVTVCPADQTDAPVPTSTKPNKPVHTITETLTTVVPCEPTSSTYTPPDNTKPPVEPTVTMTGSTTVCPTETEGGEVPSPTSDVEEPSITVTRPTGPVDTTAETPAPTEPVTEPAPTPGEPIPTETPGQPEEPSAPATPSAPTDIITEPVPTPEVPVPTDVTPVPMPTVPANSTFTTVTPPATTWTPPTVVPTPPAPPAETPIAGAGALKVGFAMVMPVVAALLL